MTFSDIQFTLVVAKSTHEHVGRFAKSHFIKMHRSRHLREKQKNIVLPLLQLKEKLFNVLEQHHPKNWDELPD